MGSRVKKTLVLVLTAQVDVRSHALTELANAGERAIDFHAAATIRPNAAGNDAPLRIMRTLEDAAFDNCRTLALANHR